MTISGKTQLCGVIGDPVAHSLSPALHNAAFSHLKLDFVFLAFRVKAVELQNAMQGMRGLGIRGLNVTMPHKTAVIRYLDDVESNVKFLASVNTILNEDGRLVGFSTDGIGALHALRENGVNPAGKKVLLLGAGGAAKAIAYTLAQEVEALCILNRVAEKAAVLADNLNRLFGKKIVGGALSPSAVQKNLQEAEILVNATSVGMHPNVNQSLVAPDWLKPDLTVMDIVYNPVETKLAKDAKAAGARVISGVEMLLYQGAASFEIWTGHVAPIEVMRTAALNQLGKVETK
ncbi:MAG: shikimate dehydrogenase [Candidatus Bathyarchaeota archaeon]|nr:shikimate dehydrogenase [Candidatus Bathyarchaeota archaeon]